MPATPAPIKKRPAPAQNVSSKASKVRVVSKHVAVPVRNAAKGGKGKEKETSVYEKKKKRNVPVTKSSREDSSEDSEDFEEGDNDVEPGEMLLQAVGPGENKSAQAGDDDEMLLQAFGPGEKKSVSVPKDPKASQERHKAQKLLHAQRRAIKPHADLITEAKGVWLLARQKHIGSSERQAHIQKLMSVVRGHVKVIVLKHDASRIIQTIVKYGGQKERNEIATELKGHYRDLAQNKYSKFLVTKLIRLCPTHRASILSEFQSHVLRLLLHREASSVLADAFELYVNAYERSLLLRDFYGKEANLFTVTASTEADKERAKKGLRGALEGADQERKRRIMNAAKENLLAIFNNSDKGAVTHAIVHRAMWEYISVTNEIPDETEREKLRREIFESCQELLAEMVHTKDGSRVVREFISQGAAKDRKQILKVIKPHIERMCLDDEAQLVLFTALDTIDDTKLLTKSVISSITETLSVVPKPKSNTSPLHATPQGRRTLISLLTPRTRRHFTPAQITLMAETDATRDLTSKKPVTLREEEVRKAASPDLVAWVMEKGENVVTETGGCLVVTEIMLYADADKTSATASLLRPLATSYPSSDSSNPHPIDLPHTSRLYKTLLQGGHFNHANQKVDYTSAWNHVRFAIAFANTVGQDVIVSMCTKGSRGGAFVVAELCSTLLEEERTKARKMVNKWFDKGVRKEIEEQEGMKGQKVLLEALGRLSC
ncbi:Armadillo-type fold [Amanita muscaria]